jgi:hypothetical protein
MCRSVEGHPAYTLHIRSGGRQTSLYLPDKPGEKVEVVEAGRRYMNALKLQRRNGKNMRKKSLLEKILISMGAFMMVALSMSQVLAAAAPATIKVGAVIPLTGVMASGGEGC